jgi:hypothetical protein
MSSAMQKLHVQSISFLIKENEQQAYTCDQLHMPDCLRVDIYIFKLLDRFYKIWYQCFDIKRRRKTELSNFPHSAITTWKTRGL